jgi:CheY-like chemotaxis protein
MTRGKRICIVEDNPLNMELVNDVLTARGYTVVQARNSKELWPLIEAEEIPDLILMDIQLPGIDGYALTQQLRLHPRWGHRPIIALTAYAMHGDREKAMHAGCNDVVTKPINFHELEERLAKFLTA